MKHNLITTFASALVTIFTIGNTQAQELGDGNVARLNKTVTYSANSNSNSQVMNSKAGNKAFKNFGKYFKNVENADWRVTEEAGFAAIFSDTKGRTTAVFDTKGSFVYSITRCSVETLPAQIKRDVKSAFDGYRIICGEEIWVEGKQIYLVHIQSYDKSRTIRIADDDMEIVEELHRS